MNGIVIVDKPQDWTSQDVVSKLRGVFQTRRIGHGGTLDPMATGVLPVFVGRATRGVEFFEHAEKTYEATIRLGIATDTEDITGTVLEERNADISEEKFLEILEQFRGDIQQIPPMYSALKVNGQKLCDLARKGKEVERKARHVAVLGYEITRIDLVAAEVDFTVHCSKGFYVRTYAHDIGQFLGCGAHLTALRRIRSGKFDISEAVDVPTLKAAGRDELLARLLPVEKVLADRS